MGTSRKRKLRVFDLQRLLKHGEKSATCKIEQRTNCRIEKSKEVIIIAKLTRSMETSRKRNLRSFRAAKIT